MVLGKISVFFARFALNNSLYDVLRDAFLGGVKTLMPSILREITFGAGGLFYLAIVLAGLSLMLPVAATRRFVLVQPQRAMLLGVLIVALFVTGASGYDFLEYVERMRVSLIRIALGNEQIEARVSEFVSLPFGAAADELNSLALDFQVPSRISERYYPEIERRSTVLFWG